MFDGHDPDAVTEARAAWKALRDGNELTYWQQDGGRWEKKAVSLTPLPQPSSDSRSLAIHVEIVAEQFVAHQHLLGCPGRR